MGTHVALPGSTRLLVPNSRPAGPADPNERVTLTIQTRPKSDPAELSAFVKEQAARPLAERRYLTRDELEAQQGARPEDLDLVEALAQKHDLAVVHRSAAERSIVLQGRLADMLAAFPADVQMYHNAQGGYRGRRGGIGVPAALEGVVTGVFGYDTRPKRRRRAYRAFQAGGPGGVRGQSPTAFAQRYAFPEEAAGKALDGAGQTIAIIELGGGFRTSDLAIYFKEIGLPTPTVVAVSVDHAGNAPSRPDSADGEVMLDVEVAGAVAPAARQVVYFAPNQGNRGFLDAINAAIHDTQRKPSVISISWGSPEDGLDEKDKQAYQDLFTAAAAIGVTICVAAGDHGVADLDGESWDGAVHVDHPAADPMVLACGGTQIDAGGRDVVWNDGTPFDGNTPDGGGWAGGGGISLRFPQPDYQAGVVAQRSLVNDAVGRGVPDIAMSATDYFTRVDTSEGASGGTSAVAPLMAALVARLNQAKGKPVGFLNPFLYANAANVMTDVTQGDNGIAGSVKGYAAGPGWDACTGLGAPNGQAILAKL